MLLVEKLAGLALVIGVAIGFVFGYPWTLIGIIGGFIWLSINVFKRRYYFLAPVLLGAVLNYSAIIANSYKMPVLNPSTPNLGPNHSVMNSETKLKPLCDVFPTGHYAVWSIGDLFLFSGLFLTWGYVVWHTK